MTFSVKLFGLMVKPPSSLQTFYSTPKAFYSSSTKIIRPIMPIEPEPEDCCGDGCQFCVIDLYNQQLLEYQNLLKEYQKNGGHLTTEESQILTKTFKENEKEDSYFDSIEKSKS